MAKVRLCSRALGLFVVLWIVAQGVGLGLSAGSQSAGPSRTPQAAAPGDDAPSALEQLHAHDHVVYLPGRCSAELTWGRRRNGAMDACIAQVR